VNAYWKVKPGYLYSISERIIEPLTKVQPVLMGEAATAIRKKRAASVELGGMK
jgi:hypothetical protein